MGPNKSEKSCATCQDEKNVDCSKRLELEGEVYRLRFVDSEQKSLEATVAIKPNLISF